MMRRVMLAIAAVTVSAFPCGCAIFHRGPVGDDLAAAREHSLRGLDAVQRGQLAEAEQLFAEAVKICPTDERARRHYAKALWRRGEVGDAIKHMEEAVRLSAGDPRLEVQLGEMYLSRDDVSKAGQLADQAIRRNSQLASAWALQGDVYRRAGRLDDALANYHRALCYQEHFPAVQFAVSELYEKAGKTHRALSTLVALGEQYPPGGQPQELLYRQGLALKSLGRHDDAVETLEAALDRGKPNPNLLFHLSQAKRLAGDSVNARIALAQALELDPHHQASLQLRSLIQRDPQGISVALD